MGIVPGSGGRWLQGIASAGMMSRHVAFLAIVVAIAAVSGEHSEMLMEEDLAAVVAGGSGGGSGVKAVVKPADLKTIKAEDDSLEGLKTTNVKQLERIQQLEGRKKKAVKLAPILKKEEDAKKAQEAIKAKAKEAEKQAQAKLKKIEEKMKSASNVQQIMKKIMDVQTTSGKEVSELKLKMKAALGKKAVVDNEKAVAAKQAVQKAAASTLKKAMQKETEVEAQIKTTNGAASPAQAASKEALKEEVKKAQKDLERQKAEEARKE